MTQRPAGEEHAHRLGEARGGRDLFDTTPVVERLLTRRFTHPKMKSKFVSTAQQLRNEGKAENRSRPCCAS